MTIRHLNQSELAKRWSLSTRTAADLDVAELTDEVHGFGIARQISVRGALEMLAAAYTFDAVRRPPRPLDPNPRVGGSSARGLDAKRIGGWSRG